mgnify:CR=1 FL=1
MKKNIYHTQLNDVYYYKINEVAKKLGLEEQTIKSMCETGKFRGAYRLDGEKGDWRIPKDNFITTKEQDEKAKIILQQIDCKNKQFKDVDEFNL